MVATPDQPQDLPSRLQVNRVGSSTNPVEPEKKAESSTVRKPDLGDTGISSKSETTDGDEATIPPIRKDTYSRSTSSRPLFAVSENPIVSKSQNSHDTGSSTTFNPRTSAFQSLSDSKIPPNSTSSSSSTTDEPQRTSATERWQRSSRLTNEKSFSGAYIGSRVEPVGKSSYRETRQSRRYRESVNQAESENNADETYSEFSARRSFEPKPSSNQSDSSDSGRHSAPYQKPTSFGLDNPTETTAPTTPAANVEETLSIGRETFDRLRSSHNYSREDTSMLPGSTSSGSFDSAGSSPQVPQVETEKAPLGEPLMVSPLSLSEEQAIMPMEEPVSAGSGELMSAALDQSILANPVMPAPKTGWRKLVHTLTGGHVNLGDPERIVHQQQLIKQVRSPLRGDYRVAILSLKGGVGKTTTSVMLGGIFASLRGDRVIAIDANPDLGTLAQRAALPGSPTIRDLLNADDVSRYSLIRNYTTQAESRLEVIGSDRDPEVSEAFSERDYRHAIDILQHHYNIILTDCGTGLMHSAMAGVLDLANTLIVVTSTALDGAQSASATLDWLNHHGYEKLVANAIVVVSASQPGPASINVQQLVDHFQARTRAVAMIPFDRHLSEGAMIDLERLDRKTYLAYLELAGLVAEDFPNWHRHAFKDQSS